MVLKTEQNGPENRTKNVRKTLFIKRRSNIWVLKQFGGQIAL